LADRSAAGRYQDVGAPVAGAADVGADGVEAVTGDPEVACLRALGAGKRSEREAVRVDDLAGLRLGAGHHQFVAGADDGDLRPPENWHSVMIHRGGEHQIAVVEAAALLEQDLTFAKVDALAADVLALDAGALDDHAVLRAFRYFLDDHAVGAGRQHAAGEDASGLARSDRALEDRKSVV